MLKKIIVSTTILTASFLLFGCARVAPVQNFYNQPVPNQLSRQQVGLAIQQAAKIRHHWRMTTLKPGLIKGTVFVRNHQATVNIPYSNKTYSIIYQNSRNLLAGHGEIHRNYNKWVTLLNRDIQHELYH